MAAGSPAGVYFGTVTSANPLEIQIEQKLTLTREFLVLTRNVTDYEMETTVSWRTDRDAELNTSHAHGLPSGQTDTAGFDSTHSHGLTGRKKTFIHNALREGEQVVLLQMQGGQRYIVLDRAGGSM